MRTRSMELCLGLLTIALLSAVPAAYAELTARVTLFDGYGDTNGGEFLAAYADFPFTPAGLPGSPPGHFETFCVETNEYIQFGTTYYADFSAQAVNGGVGGGSPDPLDRLTAYLYEEFITGQLTSYVYDMSGGAAGRIASANALQHVIWFIEQEESKIWTDGDGSLMDQFYQDALAHARPDIGNVRVVNLYADALGTQFAQDDLVLTPEPTGLALLALGPVILAWTRRRS